MPLRLKDHLYATVNSDAIYNGTYKLTLPDKTGTIALTSDGVSTATSSNYTQYLEGNGRITSADIAHMYTNNDAHQRLDVATVAMTTNKPAADGFISTYLWDNSGAYDTQVFYPNKEANNGGRPQVRYKCTVNDAFTWSSWKSLALLDDVPTKVSDLTNDSGFLTSVAWGDVTGKPTFATVATSGSYNDLSNKPTIPAAQVQSNWNQTTTTAVDYIKNKPTLATVATSGSYNDLSNKPTIPTVNNGTLTIQKNGTNVQTFTANQSGNATANITVPTKTSDITNDSGYLTSSGAVTSFNGSTGAVTYTAPVTSVNGNTGAVTISVPTKTSDLNNDSGFVTSPIQTSDINSSAVTADKIDWSTMVVVAPKVTSGTTMTLTIPAGTWKLSGCIFFVMSQNSSTYQNVGLVIGTDDRRQNTNFMVYSNAVRGNFTVIDTVTVTANTTVTLHGAGTLRYNSCSLIAERIG